MAKVALIERELKRDKLVAKYAKKHAELKGIASDMKRSDEERAALTVAFAPGSDGLLAKFPIIVAA